MDARIEDLLARRGRTLGDGLQVVGLATLVARPWDPGMDLLIVPPDEGAVTPPGGSGLLPNGASPPPDQDPLRALLPGRHGHGSDPLAMLGRLYPPAHPVLSADGPDADATIATVSPERLASGPHLVPGLEGLDNASSPHGLAWLVARLRGPDGCPWDREQDHLSLRPFLLEEAYEVYDALEGGSTPALADELGDLLLQVVLHAQFGAEAGIFDMADVQRSVMTKIVRRHPHVFGEAEARTAGDVVRNWERIKADERLAAMGASGGADSPVASAPAQPGRGPADPDMPAAFAGLSRSLPALAYADEMQERAASLGYDWPDLEGVIDKVAEEATELLAAEDPGQRTEEFGDLLFVMVNLGRKLGIDPEASLRAASRKFAVRFARVERIAGGRGLELRALGLDALDELWQEAKAEERA